MFNKYLVLFLILYINIDLNRSESNKTNIDRAIPIQSSLSRLISNYAGSPSSTPRIKFETYKALAGETIRLECPQPNPTWFFRRVNNDKYSNELGKSAEDIIVTRHGIINADYKYKIMCHMTLKHKVIIINNIEFDEEGVYTCLYTLPTTNNNDLIASNNLITSSNDNTNFNANSIQYRHVFNVTVYTLISGLTVNIKPISMRLSQMLSSTDYLNKQNQQQQQNTNQIELVDSTLTIRENEEFFFNCVVESSKPASEIKFTVLSLNENLINLPEQPLQQQQQQQQQPINPSLASSQPKLASLVSSNTNIIKNIDKTFKTIYSARLKANLNDHGKTIACNAENGFSNQKWENKKTLNVLFAPICYHKSNHIYYIGINQTLNVECKILNANPARVAYKWDLNNINGNINFQSNNLPKMSINSNNINDLKENSLTPQAQRMLNDQQNNWNQNLANSYYSNIEYNKVYNILETDSMTSRFQWKPTSLNDFGEVKCIATNEIGSTECTYELRLGGVPSPPYDCNHILKNTSAIISCQVGFHQGDPDIYCYLLRKSDNGVYKEHTRNRESCSFIVNDINMNKFNEFWIYSSNKHGHNKDNGVHLTIGEQIKEPEPTNNRMFLMIALAVGLAVFVFLACCFCFKIRKGFFDDNDSVYDTDAYQPKSQNDSDLKKNNTYPTNKMIKGVKINTDSSYDINDHIKDVKIIKPYNPRLDGTLNAGFSDNNNLSNSRKRDSFTDNNNKLYNMDYTRVTSNRHDRNYQQFVPRSRLDDRKLKFNLFKSTSTLPSNKLNRYEVKHLSISNLKTNTAQSYTHFDKLNNGLLMKNDTKSISNSTLNDAKNLKMKKSISFTKSTQQNIIGIDDPLMVKETTPFFTREKNNSLLTTVAASNSKLIHSKLSSNSINSLNDSNLIQTNGNKMVTFGSSNQSRINKLNSKTSTNQSITTLTTAIVSTTTTTTAGTNSESSNDASNNTSTTSPTCSSSNNDSEFLDNSTSPVINNSDLNSFNSSSLILPKLNTFQSDGAVKSNEFSKNLNNQSPKLQKKSAEFIETKFLNKLCEEIEVSLNVDCECADDYSSNDFSGDYSFDNDLVIRSNITAKIQNSNTMPQQQNTINLVNMNSNTANLNNNNNKTNVNYLTDLRRNFELNILQMRGQSTNYSSNRPKPPIIGNVTKQVSNYETNDSSNNSNNSNNNSNNKTNIGVLV